MTNFKSLLLAFSLFALVACDNNNKQTTETTTNTESSQKVYKLGVIAGPEQEVAEVAVEKAKQNGLNIEIVTFNDYVMPNEALNAGDIDLNAFQHRPFLDKQIADRDYKLVAIANTFVYPIAGYSKKIKTVDEITEGSTIAIPNDPTNLARSLMLLEAQGLIKLKEGANLEATALDIEENPKNLTIIEVEAPMLPNTLDDEAVIVSIINGTYAGQIGLVAVKDGVFVEDKDSAYTNTIVVREADRDAEFAKKFTEAYQSAEVEAKAEEVFKGSQVKGW